MPSLGLRLARMLWWQGLAEYAVAPLMLAVGASFGLSWAANWSGDGPLSAVFDLGLLAAIITWGVAGLIIATCWAAILWHIFWTGQAAFGVWSGLVYALMGFVLSPWPGMYVIPHMVRLDVKRLLDVVPVELAEPDAPADGEGRVGSRE